MAMEKLPEMNPPSGRVPGQGLLAAPIFKRRRWLNREQIVKKGFVLEGFVLRCKYRPKGARGWTRESNPPPHPGRGPTLGRLGPWWAPSGPPLVIPEGSFALIFYIFLP